MKLRTMKLALAVLILAGTALAQIQPAGTYALSWFYDAQGNTGIVSTVRQIDPTTKLPFTELFYSFCVETTAAVCQEGNGVIPNSAFVGTVSTKLNHPELLTLYADTTVPSMQNWLCIAPNYDTASCGSTAPGTGGLISVSFAKNNTWARLTTSYITWVR